MHQPTSTTRQGVTVTVLGAGSAAAWLLGIGRAYFPFQGSSPDATLSTAQVLTTIVLLVLVQVAADLLVGQWWGVLIALAPAALVAFVPLVLADAFGALAWTVLLVVTGAALGCTSVVTHLVRRATAAARHRAPSHR